MKLSDSKKDQYRKLAKEQGYRSRSAYKLKQINESYKILKPRISILDIGCAPGGWLQIALEKSGKNAKIYGVDIKDIDPIEGIYFIKGDIQDKSIISKILDKNEKRIDLILSDIAPNVSGFWEVDHARQIDLTREVLKLLETSLEIGGNAVFKVFQGDMLNDLKIELNTKFEKVVLTKPAASRKESSEVYFICLKYKK